VGERASLKKLTVQNTVSLTSQRHSAVCHLSIALLNVVLFSVAFSVGQHKVFSRIDEGGDVSRNGTPLLINARV
jgi:hypothetical protein